MWFATRHPVSTRCFPPQKFHTPARVRTYDLLSDALTTGPRLLKYPHTRWSNKMKTWQNLERNATQMVIFLLLCNKFVGAENNSAPLLSCDPRNRWMTRWVGGGLLAEFNEKLGNREMSVTQIAVVRGTYELTEMSLSVVSPLVVVTLGSRAFLQTAPVEHGRVAPLHWNKKKAQTSKFCNSLQGEPKKNGRQKIFIFQCRNSRKIRRKQCVESNSLKTLKNRK